MSLTQKEQTLIKDLQDQEKLCIDKYKHYAEQAKDPELKNLFNKLKENEENHYSALSQMLNNEVGTINVNHLNAAEYCPTASYGNSAYNADKEYDEFLCTDSIATEKYVSSAYDNDLFQFASTEIRDLLNQIQTDEQNHGEMIYRYKTANSMS